MSEFKFACPVCGQHITADSRAAGSQLECPTCFRKIVVPQAPTAADPKFILSATTANKPRPTQVGASLAPVPEPSGRRVVPVALIAGLVLLCGAGTAFFLLREKIFKPAAPSPEVFHAPVPAERRHGAVGLATWNTRVEYTNLEVKKGSRTLFRSDFTGSPSSDWHLGNGSWTTVSGVLRQTSLARDCRAVIGDPSWRDYTVTLRARKLNGREGFIVLFNVVDDRNWMWWNIGGWANTRHAVESCVGGVKTTLGTAVPGKIEINHWYDVRIELQAGQIRCYLDNQLVHEINYPAGPQVTVSGLR